VVAAITAAVAGVAQVQTGGGVRTLDDVKALTDAGVARVVLGSAAVANPPLVAEAAVVTAVAVGLDHRGGELAVHGWTDTSGVTLDEALRWFADTASAYIITDIGRDGMLSGPDLEGLTRAASATSVPVIASGGVATLHDIATLAGVAGIAGVITGRALYEGRFDVTAALAAVRGVS
jgi:phosphoribosylformimino-5-aminoimidazole carboxamide ribotide isomerase